MAISYLRPAVALCTLLSLTSAQTLQRNCYYPGGKYTDADTPCNPTAAHSMCCNPLDVCLSNGLCWVVAINRLSRGSCTDSTWAPESCTDICTGTDSQGHADAPGGWADVLQCANNSLPQTFYCEGSNNANCSGGSKFFNLPKGLVADHRNDTSQNSSSSNSSQSDNTTTCTSSTSGSNGTTTNSSSSVHDTCPSAAGAEAAIGAGIGIPLALGLAAAMFLFLRERRMRREAAAPFGGRQSGWISSVDRKHFGDRGADDREALIQQQQQGYEMKPTLVHQGRQGLGEGGIHEADEGLKQTVFEVPGNGSSGR